VRDDSLVDVRVPTARQEPPRNRDPLVPELEGDLNPQVAEPSHNLAVRPNLSEKRVLVLEADLDDRVEGCGWRTHGLGLGGREAHSRGWCCLNLPEEGGEEGGASAGQLGRLRRSGG